MTRKSRYAQGKIYSITNRDFPGKKYIGQTTRSLSDRLREHELNPSGNDSAYPLTRNGGAKIKLIKRINANGKKELNAVEAKIIRQSGGSINKWK